MDLWIRSQDRKRLCKPNNLFLKNKAICCNCNEEDNSFDYLGIYSTEERALKVLDEIQKILNPKGIIKFKSLLAKEDIKRIQDSFNGEFIVGDASSEIIKLGDTYVYEMPEK